MDINEIKKLIKALGFAPKENSQGISEKVYAGGYAILVDFDKEIINYGSKIRAENKTTQNFSQPENFVVLECVDRLLEKGYNPRNIILEKTYPAGHGTSGRLDICVTRDDDSEYLLIECKTYGKEFDKELSKMKKDGGQLFTYFKFTSKPDVIMLYTSRFNGKKIEFENQIVKIEDDYRTGGVKDFYDKWNKLFNKNGIFEDWVRSYCFESKALTANDLKEIELEDSGFIFNRFLEILRHNVVSDKPNAFNKIFTLFLCKILDEKNTRPGEELAFQWFNTPYQYEGISYSPDNHITFQKRLTDLYRKGMNEFLSKEVTDISDADFIRKYGGDVSETIRKRILDDLTEIRLKKNNEFAIKEVFDDDSFNDNAKVVKEVVELLQGYKIRYATKQQYLSDFFELLLTTGLKQESGQFFTPVPVAQFIIKSLPINELLRDKLKTGTKDNCLPYIIDYAAGSGHFITESMHELQRLLEDCKGNEFFGEAKKIINKAQADPYDWAFDYVYGIEKDYRLVKVGKVGCYLHGDGLANVIHSDGLGNFTKTKEYRGLLAKTNKDFPKENKQFDIVVSNPPYSVSAFKNNASKFYSGNDFELYDYLTDSSSEIECLFVERTKQLLKDGGMAGVILPSSILSNEGIYTRAREIILLHFDIIAITELGSNTFMATGTNTVVLFLRRRNNYDAINLQKSIERFFEDWQDVTRNGIEKPITKYVNHVWEDINFKDYITMLKKKPNDVVTNHEIYKEYRKKLNVNNEKDFWDNIIEIEKEKLLYFIMAYPQKVVVVKTGEKETEKRFLGYKFSDSRGYEGIHSIQGGKTISECTRLFDEKKFDNPEKASTYIYKAFSGDFDFPIHESLSNNISRIRLIDMLTFDSESFIKSISVTGKKNVQIDTKWEQLKFDEIAVITRGVTYSRRDQQLDPTSNIVLTADNITLGGHFEIKKEIFLYDGFNVPTEKILKKNDIFMCFSSGSKEHLGKVAFIEKDTNYLAGGFMGIIRTKENVLPKYLFQLLNSLLRQPIRDLGTGSNINNLSSVINNIKIPLPPKGIQQKIVAEIEVLEKKEDAAKNDITKTKIGIEQICSHVYSKYDKVKLSHLAETNPSKKEIADLDTNTLISFIDMPSLSNDGYIANKTDRPYSEIKKGSYTYFRDGDIIVAKITPCMENGKCALATNLTNGLALGSSEFHVFRANNDKIVTKYLFAMLNQKSVRIDAEKKMTGASGHRRVPITFYENLRIPLPPISEQQKIVSKIENFEVQITEAQKIIDEMPAAKNEVLKKYLSA